MTEDNKRTNAALELARADESLGAARIQKFRLEADYSLGFVVSAESVTEDLVLCEGFLARALVAAALPPAD